LWSASWEAVKTAVPIFEKLVVGWCPDMKGRKRRLGSRFGPCCTPSAYQPLIKGDSGMNTDEYKIADGQAKREWEELLGMKIHSDRVRVPYQVWIEKREQIWAIQMMSAARR